MSLTEVEIVDHECSVFVVAGAVVAVPLLSSWQPQNVAISVLMS